MEGKGQYREEGGGDTNDPVEDIYREELEAGEKGVEKTDDADHTVLHRKG